jgi:hypothetical protein
MVHDSKPSALTKKVCSVIFSMVVSVRITCLSQGGNTRFSIRIKKKLQRLKESGGKGSSVIFSCYCTAIRGYEWDGGLTTAWCLSWSFFFLPRNTSRVWGRKIRGGGPRWGWRHFAQASRHDNLSTAGRMLGQNCSLISGRFKKGCSGFCLLDSYSALKMKLQSTVKKKKLSTVWWK